jgi:hypothetical protein
MKSSWQNDAGQIACRWTEVTPGVRYDAPWMSQASRSATDTHGSYQPPLPDFASHSPFAGADWFVPSSVRRWSQ